MSENFKKFLEKVTEYPELVEKVKTETDIDKLIAIANELGIVLTKADFEKKAEEIDDDELDAIAGGATCGCAVGGGGSQDSNDKTCACVIGGFGDSKDGRERCVCGIAGYGYDN